MERGAHIGVGVKAVEELHHMDHPVVPGELHGPELLTVGKQDVHRHRGPVGNGDIADELLEGGHIVQKGIDVHADDKDKPEKVWDHEPLAEGNVGVQGAGHDMIAVPDPHPLQYVKHNAEGRPE